MSKASQREARERKTLQDQERRSRFLTTLKEWLSIFASYYQNQGSTASEEAVTAYRIGLEDLSEAELKLACAEAIKVCAFTPKVSDIREGLRAARDRIGYGHSPAEAETGTPITKQEREAIAKSIREVGKSFGEMPDRFKGQHYTRETGWMPTSGAVKDEKPELNRVDMRASAQWSSEEKEIYMLARGFTKEGAVWKMKRGVREAGED